MPQAFQARTFFVPKTDPKQEVYKPVPYYFGTLTTQDTSDHIAEESSPTKGNVLNVLDRYQQFVIKNLQKGYKVEMLRQLQRDYPETRILGHYQLSSYIHKACPCFDAREEYG